MYKTELLRVKIEGQTSTQGFRSLGQKIYVLFSISTEQNVEESTAVNKNKRDALHISQHKDETNIILAYALFKQSYRIA